MTSLPKVKGPRQGDFAVTYYALGRTPTPTGLHGYFINIGTFDTEKQAEIAAEDARLALQHIGGVVTISETGLAEPMLSDEARASRPKTLVSSDLNSMYNRQQREEREKLAQQQKEMRERQQQLQEEEETDDPASLAYYAKLHMRRRMMEESKEAQRLSMISMEKKLAELNEEIATRGRDRPDHVDRWRDYFREKIGKSLEEPFFLKERG